MGSRTGAWTAVATGDGSITLAHPQHGETCHSRAGAWTQARERYASACRIRARAIELRAAGETHLHLLDIGTGLGLNIAAALEAVEGTGVALDVTSLEIDPSVIEAALAIGTQPLADLERVHAPVRSALARALVQLDCAVELGVDRGGGRLRLHLGDGRVLLGVLDPDRRFDAVFLDPFSPRVDPSLWEPACLAAVARRMAPGSRLSTYSAAVRVRAGLLAAGLHVGPGARVQDKAQGTLAGPDPLPVVFDARTQRRLESRSRPVGMGSTGEPVRGFSAGNGLPDPR
jgi:tRNA U34 5-methylaminomethyl-2-thiouridine-forming methyltransferase MnmC